MKNKQNYNTVKVEIPIIGEYILTILDHMLIVKCIMDQTYQYSEFTYIANKYVMTSVNCRTGNIMRIMEEFCKANNCPKRVLREEIDKAEKLIKKSNDIKHEISEEVINENKNLKNDIAEYKKSISIYEDTIKTYNNLISDLESKFCAVLNELTQFKLKLNKHIDIISGKNDDEILSRKIRDKKSDDIVFTYEKIKEFMDSNSEQKNDSKCLINKFYEEFIKTLDKNELDISYDIFVDFLKDIYRNHKNIKINDENKLIYNIIYRKNIKKSINKLSIDRKSSKNMLDKSTVVNSRSSGCRNSKNKTYTRNIPITINDSKVILDMWKTMTARQISEIFPMYSVSQIGQYCSTHSDFVKIGTPKKLIDQLKSYNGTKTLQEMGKLCGRAPSNVKKLCKTYNILYKEL